MAEYTKDELIKSSVEPLERVEARVQWRGALPNPETLREYEATIPGAAERILRLAEQEQSLRIEFEKAVFANETRYHLLARIGAVALQVASAALAVFVFLNSESSAGLILSISILVFPALPALMFEFLSRHEKSRGEE